MKPAMSKEAEARIVTCLGQLATAVQAGATPTEALAKVAADAQLLPGHIRLMAYAYNTGRTTQQRESSEDLLDKLAEFPLADAETVIEQLCPAATKSAAARFHETAVSPEYAWAPTWYAAATEKAAYAPTYKRHTSTHRLSLYERPADEASFAQDYRQAKQAGEALSPLRSAWHLAQRQLADAFEKLAESFRRGTLRLEDVRTNAELYHGPRAGLILDYVAPRLSPLLKTAACNPNHRIDWEQGPYYHLTQCMQLADDLATKQAAYDAAREQHRQDCLAMLQRYFPCLKQAASDELLEHDWVGEKASSGFGAGMGFSAAQSLMNALGHQLQGPDPEQLVQKQLAALADPNHDELLRRIRAQATLQDLMSHDELLSDADLNELTNAYNQVSQLAPRAADQPAVLQPALHKHLQHGGLEAFDAGQLLDAESRLKALAAPAGKT